MASHCRRIECHGAHPALGGRGVKVSGDPASFVLCRVRLQGTRDEHTDVLACLNSIDKILAKPQSVVMRVEQVYLHCAKAFMRSRLWDHDSWPADRPVPTLGEMIHDQIGEDAPAETQEAMIARYRQNLY